MKSFSNEALRFKIFFQKVPRLPYFECYQNGMSSANLIAENQLGRSNERVLSTGALEKHVLVNMLLCSSHFTEVN